jgi:hypothetical protein
MTYGTKECQCIALQIALMRMYQVWWASRNMMWYCGA